MDTYIGIKMVRAKLMTRGEYNEFRGWVLPPDENPEDEGCLVEYLDGGKPNTTAYDGYVSWSPLKQFANAYFKVSGLSFGHAIAALKLGKRVARAGWNGKDMWLALSPGTDALPASNFWAGPNRDYANANGGTAPVLPSITMKTATGEILMGWLASQTDMLSDDWLIV